MKRISKILMLTILAVMLVCISVIPAFAAGTTVNGNEAAVGSKVQYTLSISDAHQKICGIHFVVFFDTQALKLVELNADNIGGTINDNQNGDGQIVVVNGLINGASGLKCEEKTTLITATFEVIGEGDTNIEYYIPYMYDYDMVNIYEYTLTQDITVDGVEVIKDKAPELADVSKLDGFDAGDFANNEEGTGSGEKPVVTQPQNSPSSNTDSQDGEKPDNKVVVAIVVGAVLVVAIVVLVVVKAAGSKKASVALPSDNDKMNN